MVPLTWKSNTYYIFREFSHQLILYTHNLRTHVGILFTQPWILSWKQRKNDYPQSHTLPYQRHAKMPDIWFYTGTQTQRFEFTATKFSYLVSHLLCFPWKPRKSSKIHYLWSAFFSLMFAVLQFAHCNRFMLILGTHQCLLGWVCLSWAASKSISLLLPIVQSDKARFINGYILHLRDWDVDLLISQTIVIILIRDVSEYP